MYIVPVLLIRCNYEFDGITALQILINKAAWHHSYKYIVLT